MKRINIFLLFMFFSLALNAQDSGNIKIGETLEIGDAKTFGYAHIEFPRANFILKKGGRLNFNRLPETKVIITDIKPSGANDQIVTLERGDGKKFFGNFTTVKAHYQLATESGELTRS